jgi:hypothetical protein
MGEGRRVRGGKISGMKNPSKWEHRVPTVRQLSVSQRLQPVNLGLVIGHGQDIERSLRLCVEGRLLVARDSQEGSEGCNIFSLSAGQILLQVRFIICRKGNGFMLREQESVFIPPGVARGRACDVGGGICHLFNRAFECAAGRKEK